MGAGVGQFVGSTKLAEAIGAKSPLARDIFVSMADAVGNAATRTLINGSDFGDNVAAALPDVIGGAIGRRIGEGVLGALSEAARVRAEAAEMKAAVGETQKAGIKADFLDRVADMQTAQLKRVAELLRSTDPVVNTDRIAEALSQNLLFGPGSDASLQLIESRPRQVNSDFERRLDQIDKGLLGVLNGAENTGGSSNTRRRAFLNGANTAGMDIIERALAGFQTEISQPTSRAALEDGYRVRKFLDVIYGEANRIGAKASENVASILDASNALRAVGCTLGCTIFDQAPSPKAGPDGNLKLSLATAPSL